MVKDQTIRTITVTCDYCEPESSAKELSKIVATGEDPMSMLFIGRHGWVSFHLPSTDGVKSPVLSYMCDECVRKARTRASK